MPKKINCKPKPGCGPKTVCKPTCKPKGETSNFFRSRSRFFLALCALFIVIGGGVLATQAWTDPSTLGYSIVDGVPTGNVSGLLNTSTTTQGKLGNLGIGTASPLSKLDVRGTATFGPSGLGYDVLEIAPGTAAVGQITTIKAFNSNSLQLTTHNGSIYNDGLFINTSGNIGIGTTSPTAKLQIDTSFSGVSNNGLYINNSPNAGYAALKIYNNYTDNNGGDNLIIANASGQVLKINSNGDLSLRKSITVTGYVTGQTGLCIGGDCKTSWPTISSYSNLPAGSVAGYCYAAGTAIAPAVWSGFCTCVGGWNAIQTGGVVSGVYQVFHCIKN